MRLTKKDIIVDIEHPNHSEVVVSIRQLSEFEKTEYYSLQQSDSRAEVLKDPDTHEYIYEEDELTNKPKLMIHEKKVFNMQSLTGLLSKAIISVKGLERDNGTPYIWDSTSPEIMEEIVKSFFDDALICSYTKDEKPIKEAFWAYLNRKLFDKDTFNPGPLVTNT